MQLRNTSTDEIVQLSDGLTLGRHPECGYVVSDSSISRVHAKIEWRNEAFILTDQQSSNGCSIDGRKQEIIRLQLNAIVSLGDVKFEVIDETATANATTNEAKVKHLEQARRRQDIIAEPSSSGMGDLSQQPLIIRALALGLGLGVMFGVVYLVRKAGEVF